MSGKKRLIELVVHIVPVITFNIHIVHYYEVRKKTRIAYIVCKINRSFEYYHIYLDLALEALCNDQVRHNEKMLHEVNSQTG